MNNISKFLALVAATLGATSAPAICADATAATAAQYEAACTFIASQRKVIDSFVLSRDGSEDTFLSETESKARAFRYAGKGLTIDYFIAQDGKKAVRGFELSEEYLRRRRFDEQHVATQLQLPAPLPASLKLGCDVDELRIVTRKGRLSGLAIKATFVD